MPVTRSDVARAAGVSPAVVSYVINNGPRPVSATTRERVEAAIADLGYRPNAIASSLRNGSTRSIGYLTPNPRDPFMAELGESVERQFSARGYLVLTGNTYFDRAREERYLQSFIDRNVDGLVFAPGVSLASTPTWQADRPVVSLDGAGTHPGWSTVSAQDALDAATAVGHLVLQHGHMLVACIAGTPRLTSEAERIAGWRTATGSEGLPSGPELLAYGEISEEGGYSAAMQLLSSHGRPWVVHGRGPTAVFATNDAQAVGVISACAELGLRVPEDVAVVAVGGTRIAPYTVPPLSTVRQDVELIAELAARQLIAGIADPTAPAARSRLRGNLVVARSCGCELLAPSAVDHGTTTTGRPTSR
ncbi:LacI family DNA-binding transcriptional regulator [Curtobacterium sp. MCBD17_035]|uniref:LacI family DNA-binding transcriptional regulator n=1 Tax=Curtobacterium sp. MCBD17_035 TaxID=2175673 RepID=UPI000DAAB366|nr:LacI family DNA-binding transcriptional regulator [Curtobacterium sp. MCBD17_035]WIB67046.1 LacI family DNA-binding transcriptional regulator [Curtobacterium sp. MCBD17_035]